MRIRAITWCMVWASLLPATAATAQTIYLEDFNGWGGTPASIGWTRVQNDGTTLTSTTGSGGNDVEGSHRVYASSANTWYVTDASTFASISQVRWLDRSSSENYRLGLKVAGTWYLSAQTATSVGGGFDPGDGAHPGITITDFSSGFSPWSGAPADDATAWNLTSLGAAGALPAGDITGVALMNVSSSCRFDYFEVTGALPSDTDPPTTVTLSPTNTAVNVGTGPDLVVTFNENIQEGSGFIRIREFVGDAAVETIDVTSGSATVSGDTLTITPTTTLAYDTQYYVEIDSGAVEDLSANDFGGISGNSTWSFTTLPAPLYVEDLNLASGNQPISAIGWTAVRGSDGATYTESDLINNSTDVEGSHRVFSSAGSMWLVTDAPALESILQVRWLDRNSGVNYRLGLEVGGSWYLSDVLSCSADGGFDPGDGAHPGVTLADFSSGFSSWSGAPADDATAWDTTSLGAPGALPSGDITRVGVMWVSSTVRFDYLEVTGTVPVDSDPPDIAALSPTNNATGVVTTDDLIASFDEDIQVGTGQVRIRQFSDDTTVCVLDVTGGNVTISSDTNAILTPTNLAAATTYYIEIDSGAFEDLQNNDFAGVSGNAEWRFTTEGSPPLLDSVSPTNGATGAGASAPLVATFNEDVQAGSGNIRIREFAGDATVCVLDVTGGNVSISGADVSIVPTNLNSATQYYVEIDSGAIEDLSSLAFAGISGSATWSFTTGTTFTEDFEAGSGSQPWSLYGWTAVQNTGTTRTGNGEVIDGTDVEGSRRTFLSGMVWFVTDVPALETISQVRWLDRSSGINYRLGLEVGGTWYLSAQTGTTTGGGFDPGDGAHPGITITDFSSGFASWSGAPSDDATAWDLSSLGTPGALPAGEVTRVGMMLVSGTARFDYLEVTGDLATDTTAPALAGLNPTNTATDVLITSDLVASFDELIQKGAGDIRIRALVGDAVVQTIDVTSGDVTISGFNATIDPPSDLATGTGYYVEIDNGAIEDLVGNPFAGFSGNGTWSFTTDGTAPVLSSVSPTNGATGAGVMLPLVANFDEDIQKGTGDLLIRTVADDTVVSTIDVTSGGVLVSGAELRFAPPSDLDYSTGYYIEMDGGAIEDLSGNAFAGISGNAMWHFTTMAEPLYLEDLNFPSGNHAFSEIGWTVVRSDGTRDTDALLIIADTSVEGSHRVYSGDGNLWFVTDAPVLGTITKVRWLDANGGQRYRLGFEINDVWYLSAEKTTSTAGGFDPGDVAPSDGSHPGVTISDFSSGFAPWGTGTTSTGAPVDDTEAWDLSTLGAYGALPESQIDRIGLMRIDGSVRFDYFEVTGRYVSGTMFLLK